MFENNLWTMEPVGRPENTIQGDKYRFTLLTPCLIRMEYREDGKFEDRPTQVVWNRKFDPVDFRVEKKGEGFELFTSRMHVTYAGGPFTKNSLNLNAVGGQNAFGAVSVSYTHLRAHETGRNLVCRLLLEKKKTEKKQEKKRVSRGQ